MPDGLTHSLATVLLAGALGYGATYLHRLDQPHALALAGGALTGLLLTPDLDVNTGSVSDDWARRTFGRGPAALWWLIWRPYSWLIPHRSILSHFPLLGTILRLGYLSGAVWVLAWLLHLLMPLHIPAIHALPWWFGLGFAGLFLSDLLHWFMDITTTAVKRRFYRSLRFTRPQK